MYNSYLEALSYEASRIKKRYDRIITSSFWEESIEYRSYSDDGIVRVSESTPSKSRVIPQTGDDRNSPPRRRYNPTRA